MRILIVDDNQEQLTAAKEQLGSEHELVTMSRYEEAENILARVLRGEEPPFDAVLTDLLMPAPRLDACRSSNIIGQEMPIGTTLAFLALRAGTNKVAVVSNMNHHKHPASAALDPFLHPFRLGDCVILLTNCHLVWHTETKDWSHALYELINAAEQ